MADLRRNLIPWGRREKLAYLAFFVLAIANLLLNALVFVAH